MAFLIKASFWLALILMVLPIDRHEAGLSAGPGTFETLAAMRAVFTDVRGFCERNPQACATGGAAADVLRQRAIYTAGALQNWLSDDAHSDTHLVDTPLPTTPSQGQPDRDAVAALILAADQSDALQPL